LKDTVIMLDEDGEIDKNVDTRYIHVQVVSSVRVAALTFYSGGMAEKASEISNPCLARYAFATKYTIKPIT